MTARSTNRFLVIGATLLALGSVAGASLAADEPIPALYEAKAQPLVPKPSNGKAAALQLRDQASKAEKAGDWEAAFAAYCELSLADRTDAELRKKLNASLRRVQQVRRHRDPAFQHFVNGLSSVDAINLFAEVAAKVPGMFADPTKSTPQHLWANGVEELDRALGSPGFLLAFLDKPSIEKVEAFRASLRTFWSKRTVNDAREARTALKQLFAAAQDAFAVRIPAALAVEFVCGACSGLDEYTVFLSPTHAVENEPLADLSLYGVYLGFHEGVLTVDGVVPGSWAAFHTALRKGVKIAKVNGRSVGESGTKGLHEALRTPLNGFHKIECTASTPDTACPIESLPVAMPTVWGRIVNTPEGVVIGHVRIAEFQTTTPQEFNAVVEQLRREGMRAMLLDLRGNRGGSFLAGVEVARRLLPGGLIVTAHGQLDDVAGRVFSSDSGMSALDVPAVVLIDSETASAAEVVAAALKDNGRAVIVGMPSFGKGAIQYQLNLAAADDPDDMGKPRGKSGSVRLTIARLVSPSGKAINGAGVPVDIFTTDPALQLERAIERAIELERMRSPMPLPPNQ